MSDYSVWLLETSYLAAHGAENVYSGLYRQGETLYFPHSFLYVSGGGHKIVIDAGINFAQASKQKLAEHFQIQNAATPREALAGIGVDIADIDSVIVTHAHFDHIGGISDYPNAKIYIQRAEVDDWMRVLSLGSEFSVLRAAIDSTDFFDLLQIACEGRLVMLDGEIQDLFPGIHIWVERNGHSFASQLALIENSDGSSYIYVGDVVYSSDNLTGVPGAEHFIPNTSWSVGGPAVVFGTYRRIMDYVDGDVDRVIIPHDYQMWERFPTWKSEAGHHVAEIHLASEQKSLFDGVGSAQSGSAS